MKLNRSYGVKSRGRRFLEQITFRRKRRNPTRSRFKPEDGMLYYAVVFLVIALIAGALGFGGVAAVSANIAHVLFVIFLVLFLITLVLGIRARY